MRKGDLRVVAGLAQSAERRVEIGASDEQVEVFRLANDSRVVEKCVGAADEERHTRVAEDVERAAVERIRVASWIVEGRLIGHGSAIRMRPASASPGLARGLG